MILHLLIIFIPLLHSFDVEEKIKFSHKGCPDISLDAERATNSNSTITDSTIQKEYKIQRTHYESIALSEDMLFSSSFGFIATTFGVLAKTVRITGDTAAGVLGSSIKLVGMAIKSSALKLDEAGKWMEDKHRLPKNNEFNRDEKRCHRLMKSAGNTRSITLSKSIKMMGNVVEEFGYLLIKTGAATESLASLASAMVEGSVRILEDAADEIARTSSPNRSKKRLLVRPIQGSSFKSAKPSFSFGAYKKSNAPESEKNEEHGEKGSKTIGYLQFLLHFFLYEMVDISSLTFELPLAILLSYLASILILNKAREDRSNKEVYNRYLSLLVVFLFVYFHICYTSHLRTKLVYADAEANGLRFALQSSMADKQQETAVWLNALLKHFWRVPSSECPPYSEFVIQRCNQKPSINCLEETVSCKKYGGLEPFLSWKIGSGLSRAFQNAMSLQAKRDQFVSLHSITLGSHPPLIRSIETLSENNDEQFIDYFVEADLFLQDLLIVLDIKMSSLDYAILPRTKVSIGSMVTNVKCRIRVHKNPYPPFFGKLEFSLKQVPEFHVRINSLSEGSFYDIELSSLPLIRDLIQSVYRRTMTMFVSPNYLAVDVSNLSRDFIEALYNKKLYPSSPAFSPHSRKRGQTQKRQNVAILKQKESHSFVLVRPTTKAAQIGLDLWLKNNSKSDSHPERK